MMWGPPRIRLDGRPLETALQEPFDLDAAAVFQVAVWSAGFLLTLFILGGRGLEGKPFIPRIVWKSSLVWYLGYGVLALASSVYSTSPLYTLFFAGKIFVSIFAVALLTDKTDLTSRMPLVLKLFLVVNIVQLVLNIALFAADPALVGKELPGIGYRLAGGILEDYGTPAAMAGCLLLSQMFYYTQRFRRASMGALYLGTWVFVLLSRTRSTIIGASAMLLLTLTFYQRLSGRILGGLVVSIALVAVVISQSVDSIVVFGMRGETVNSLLSLTGRAQAFEFLSYEWSQSPWWGFGYASGSRQLLIRFVKESGLGIGAAHDAASKVLVELGIIGASFLLIVFTIAWLEVISLVRLSAYNPKVRPLAIQVLLLLTFFSLINAVSAGIAEASYPYLVISVTTTILRSRLAISKVESSQQSRPSPGAKVMVSAA